MSVDWGQFYRKFFEKHFIDFESPQVSPQWVESNDRYIDEVVTGSSPLKPRFSRALSTVYSVGDDDVGFLYAGVQAYTKEDPVPAGVIPIEGVVILPKDMSQGWDGTLANAMNRRFGEPEFIRADCASGEERRSSISSPQSSGDIGYVVSGYGCVPDEEPRVTMLKGFTRSLVQAARMFENIRVSRTPIGEREIFMRYRQMAAFPCNDAYLDGIIGEHLSYEHT